MTTVEDAIAELAPYANTDEQGVYHGDIYANDQHVGDD